jgi:hypothetical protein
MPKPSSLPAWNTGGANSTEPSGAKKILGWIVDEAPPSSYFNWWQKLVYDWMVWLNAFESTAHTWTADQNFKGIDVDESATINENLSVNGNASVAGTFTPGTDVAGNLPFSNANPSGFTSFTNTLTPLNIAKVFGRAFSNGATADIDAPFNVTSVSLPGSSKFRVTFGGDMAGVDYTVPRSAQKADGTPLVATVATYNAGYVEFKFWDMAGGAIDPAGVDVVLDFAVFGQQGS